jgi:kynureninase
MTRHLPTQIDFANPHFAQIADESDPLINIRSQFHLPTVNGEPALYFCGHSLGPMPKTVRALVEQEFYDWEKLGVEGHFHAKNPWLPYHEFLTPMMSKIVGGQESEVVVMNTLTVNLHLMLVSFYRPDKKRYKILIEKNTFPSDKYAVDSQARFHGFDPQKAIIELPSNLMTSTTEQIISTIEVHADELALIMLGNCNYLSGQNFDMEKIVKVAHQHNILVGFNLAHGAGNIKLKLHDWQVDFAVWCSYKYLNAGPGNLAGCFVHQNHHGKTLPRFEGWWGHDKSTRFKMGPQFSAIPTAEAWQLSNPPIFQLAALRASLEIFNSVGMDAIVKKSQLLTGYFEYLLKNECLDQCQVITPADRGSMLCLQFKKSAKDCLKLFNDKRILCDFREPDILRITPAPLYNSFKEVTELVAVIKSL